MAAARRQRRDSLPAPPARTASSRNAATGILRGWFGDCNAADQWLGECVRRAWKGVIEFSGEAVQGQRELWPLPGGDFEIMKRVKSMFDPEGLLNSGRLYGVI